MLDVVIVIIDDDMNGTIIHEIIETISIDDILISETNISRRAKPCHKVDILGLTQESRSAATLYLEAAKFNFW